MKFLKDNLGVSDLETRVKILEDRIDQHEVAIRAMADAIRSHSANILIMSDHIKNLIKLLEKGNNKSHMAHQQGYDDDTYN
jgi:hypothetical protein